MEDGIRYIVQINVNGKGWNNYRAARHSKGYSLTAEESLAYMATLPATVKTWQKSETGGIKVEVPATYRVIKSECVDGLITQSLV